MTGKGVTHMYYEQAMNRNRANPPKYQSVEKLHSIESTLSSSIRWRKKTSLNQSVMAGVCGDFHSLGIIVFPAIKRRETSLFKSIGWKRDHEKEK